VRRDRFLPEDRVAGDDLAFRIKPIKEYRRVEFQRVGNFEALGPREGGCSRIVGAPPGNDASPCSALPSPSLLAGIVLPLILVLAVPCKVCPFCEERPVRAAKGWIASSSALWALPQQDRP
jgi:hypothetical protein